MTHSPSKEEEEEEEEEEENECGVEEGTPTVVVLRRLDVAARFF